MERIEARNVAEGSRLVTPEATLTEPVEWVEWVAGDDPETVERVVVATESEEYVFAAATEVTQVADDETPSADDLHAAVPVVWTVPEEAPTEAAAEVFGRIAATHGKDAVGRTAQRQVEKFSPTGSRSYDASNLAFDLFLLADDANALAICRLFDAPFRDYDQWGGTGAAIALGSYLAVDDAEAAIFRARAVTADGHYLLLAAGPALANAAESFERAESSDESQKRKWYGNALSNLLTAHADPDVETVAPRADIAEAIEELRGELGTSA